MNLRAIAGLPRSGSTLLCNLLAQNPAFRVGSTSCVPQALHNLSAFLSTTPEVKSDLAHDRAGTEIKVREAMRSFVSAWYGNDERIVFDKSRAWPHNAALLFDLFPDAHLVLCVRDPRGVFGSIEKQHMKFPAFDDSANPNDRTMFARADRMFSPEGIIGITIVGIEDVVRRFKSRVSVVQYETFAAQPEDAMRRLYAEMGDPWFAHDFESVEPTATDLDALYLHKFPHEGSGKVMPPRRDEWREYVTEDIAGLIMARYADFNRAFGYMR